MNPVFVGDEDSKTYAMLLLEGLGYTVTEIPESRVLNEERADLKAVRGRDDVLIVKAKGKDPHKVYCELVAEAESKGSATRSRAVVSWSALSSVIEKATRQLQATPAPETAPRVILISCIHDDWRYVLDAFRYRLYGEVELALWRGTGGIPEHAGTLPCFYYDFSEFRRYPNLEAVILGGPEGQQLLINEFAERTTFLRKSRLYSEALNTKALCDPEVKRAAGEALAVLAAGVLDQQARWQYLLDMYGFMTNIMTPHQFNALAIVPVQE